MKILTLTEPKPGATHNEDLFGSRGDTAWLLDGATSKDGPELARDAHWFVHRMSAALTLLAEERMPLPEMVAQATEMVARDYPADAAGMPRAALALIRRRRFRLEMALVGANAVLVCTPDKVYEYVDTRVAPGHETKDEPLLEACRRGMQFEDEEFQALRRQMKQAEAKILERSPDGLLGPCPTRPDQLIVAEHLLTGDEELLLATDGILDLRAYLGLSNHAFAAHVRENWGPMLLEQLRAFESADDSGRRLPRTKRHDDATLAWLRG